MYNKIYIHPGSPLMDDYLTDTFSDRSIVNTLENAQGVLYFPSTGSIDLTGEEAAQSIDDGVNRLITHFTNHIGAPWMVFGSSYHVYGFGERNGITETQTGGMVDKVGHALRQAEERLQREWPGKVLILRCAPIFGEGAMEAWIMRMFDQVMRGLYFNIRDCDSQRSMVLAYDVARLSALLAGECGVYNVSDGFNRTLSALALAMGNNHGQGKRPFTLPQKWARIAAATIGKLGMVITREEVAFRSTNLTLSTDKLTRHLAEVSSPYVFHDTVAVVGRQDDKYPYRRN